MAHRDDSDYLHGYTSFAWMANMALLMYTVYRVNRSIPHLPREGQLRLHEEILVITPGLALLKVGQLCSVMERAQRDLNTQVSVGREVGFVTSVVNALLVVVTLIWAVSEIDEILLVSVGLRGLFLLSSIVWMVILWRYREHLRKNHADSVHIRPQQPPVPPGQVMHAVIIQQPPYQRNMYNPYQQPQGPSGGGGGGGGDAGYDSSSGEEHGGSKMQKTRK